MRKNTDIRIAEYCKNYKVPTAFVVRELRKEKIKISPNMLINRINVAEINKVIYNFHKKQNRRVLIDYELYCYNRSKEANFLNNLEITTINDFINDNFIYKLNSEHIIKFLEKFDRFIFNGITSTTEINIIYLEYYLFAYEIPKRNVDIDNKYYNYAPKQIREIEKNRRLYFKPNNIDISKEECFNNGWHYLEIKFIRLYRFDVTDYNKNPYFINEVSHHLKKIFTVWLSTFCDREGKELLMYEPFIDNWRYKKYRKDNNA